MSLFAPELDGLQVMRKNAPGDFLGLRFAALSDGLDDIGRDLLEGFDIEIATGLFD